MIVELRQSLLSTDFQDAPDIAFDALFAAKASVSNIRSSTFKSRACRSLHTPHVKLLEFYSRIIDCAG